MADLIVWVLVILCLIGGALGFMHEWKLSKLEKQLRNAIVLVSIESEKRRKIEAEIDEIRGKNEAEIE